MIKPLIYILPIIFFISCSKVPDDRVESALGTVQLEVSGAPEAVVHFEKGLLLLHSFEYADARISFRKAQEIDPDLVMAYWGEAMTRNHPLWAQQNYEEGQAILERLGPSKEIRLSKAVTPLEKDMLSTVEVLFGEGSKIERDDAYAAHMADLYVRYPGNHEVAAFYALSLLGSVEAGRNYEVYGKGARIAQGILDENPSHPGALHYLIHSYDDPDHAFLAIEAANSYAQVAPDAGHALHMPSHIYIALGMWDEVINSNIASYEARLKKIADGRARVRNLHAYHWLQYGYLQRGDYDEATTIMEDMIPYLDSMGASGYVRTYGIEMAGNYLAETGDWNGPFSAISVEVEDLNVKYRVQQQFLEGYVAFINQDREALQTAIDQMQYDIAKASDKLVTQGITVCSGVSYASKAPDQSDIDVSKTLMLELRAFLAMLNGKESGVEALLVQATELENSISFSFGPPSIFFPSYEVYGRWLLERERYEDAMIQFDKSLEKGPKRRTALMGKLEAARGSGQNDLAASLESELGFTTVSS